MAAPALQYAYGGMTVKLGNLEGYSSLTASTSTSWRARIGRKGRVALSSGRHRRGRVDDNFYDRPGHPAGLAPDLSGRGCNWLLTKWPRTARPSSGDARARGRGVARGRQRADYSLHGPDTVLELTPGSLTSARIPPQRLRTGVGQAEISPRRANWRRDYRRGLQGLFGADHLQELTVLYDHSGRLCASRGGLAGGAFGISTP